MLKRIKDVSYLINVQSDKLSQAELIEMIEHIYSSMKQGQMD